MNTKRDYERAARLVMSLPKKTLDEKREIAYAFATFFIVENSRFDLHKFLKACGCDIDDKLLKEDKNGYIYSK